MENRAAVVALTASISGTEMDGACVASCRAARFRGDISAARKEDMSTEVLDRRFRRCSGIV
jgi:hypothetical protein